jgi:hypothetical protein
MLRLIVGHVPKKLTEFFDRCLLYLIDFERFLFDHMIPCMGHFLSRRFGGEGDLLFQGAFHADTENFR